MTTNPKTVISKWFTLAVVLLVLTVVTLGGIISTYQQSSIARQNTKILRCQAEAERQFRRDIAELLRAGRNPKLYGPLIVRMTAESNVNYAELVDGHCQPVLIPKTTTTSMPVARSGSVSPPVGSSPIAGPVAPPTTTTRPTRPPTAPTSTTPRITPPVTTTTKAPPVTTTTKPCVILIAGVCVR